jgi:hypothetical protein
MIIKVEKIYNFNSFSYSITLSDGKVWSVPLDDSKHRLPSNSMEWIAEGNTVIDNGGNN